MSDERNEADLMQVRRDESDWWFQLERDTLLFSKEYGQSTIKSLITINGGAIIALLSFLASTVNSIKTENIFINAHPETAFWSFALGLVFAIISGGMGYMNFQFVNQSMPGPNGLNKYILYGDVAGWSNKRFALILTSWVALICTLISGAFFIFGAWRCATIIELVSSK